MSDREMKQWFVGKEIKDKGLISIRNSLYYSYEQIKDNCPDCPEKKESMQQLVEIKKRMQEAFEKQKQGE